MAYEEDTLKLCHELTSSGEVAYRKMLEDEADKMLAKSEHKVLAFFIRLLDCLKISDSLVLRKYDKILEDIAYARK